MISLILFVSIVILWIYLNLQSRHKYWQYRKFPNLKPGFVFGNAEDLCLGRKSMPDYQTYLYRKAKPTKLLGIFMFYKPTLYIADIQWISNVLNKDFRYFTDRGLRFDTDNEPLTKHLFHLEGPQWRIMKQKLMPLFMADGVKTFLPLLITSAIKLKDYLKNEVQIQNDLDLKDILSKYAADVIGNCAYGIDCEALNGGNTEFYTMSKKIFAPRIRTIIKLILPRLPNFISELFDIKMIGTRVSYYFKNIAAKQIEIRRRSAKDFSGDFLSFMMDLHNDSTNFDNLPVTDDLIIAQCFMFFIAGYENTSGVLCATLFELADHPEIQDKLFDELNDACFAEGILEITYEKISKMAYLDMVVSEILRIYPPASAVIRECNQDYNIAGTEFTLEKGLQIIIPVCGIHLDSKYYPYANEFNPLNFSEEAKAIRPRCAYMPFGDGPRYCIGKKFGLSQIKVALILLILNYKFHPSSKMKRPVTFEKNTFITSIEGGAWVRAEFRSESM